MDTPEIFDRHTDDLGCLCPACTGGLPQPEISDQVDISLDPQAGSTFANKPIWTPEQIAGHLNRTTGGWGDTGARQPGADGDLLTITFGFHTSQASLQANGYVFTNPANGRLTAFTEYFQFAAFSEAQRAATREAMRGWDDVVAVRFVESDINNADITFGNLTNSPGRQAYAYLPNSNLNGIYGGQVRELGGDVWVGAGQASNFQLDEGGYGLQTLAHEIGHAIGISHPGAYNAGQAGGPINYAAHAEYAQDTRAYSIMSYFNASVAGARHFDFNISTTVFAGTPLIHDIATAQRIYGADMTTRTGDTVYGFNSNAGRDEFDFTRTPAPVAAIWDAGGIDTIDASGYATTQLIDLTPGSLSSIGGVTFDTAPSFEQVNANRAAAGFAPLARATYDANMASLAASSVVGRLTDNFGIAYGVTIENAIGGSGADTITGNAAANTLTGNAGDDTLSGRSGDDVLNGGLGKDTLNGDEGVDTLDGGAGDDTLNGGAGNDLLNGGAGKDSMAGGAGDDQYDVDDAGDSITELVGEGLDSVRSTINLTLGANLESLTLAGAAALEGTGNELANVITGNEAANVLSGLAGNDTLFGRGGDDTLLGGAGDDILAGGAGADLLDGGEGFDFASYRDSATGVTVTVSNEGIIAVNGDGVGDRFVGIEGFEGSGLDDVLTGGSLGDFLSGGAGNDRINGDSGADTLRGGAGDDTLDGGNEADTLFGDAGNDTLKGGNAGDTLNGGDGNDTLEGENDADTLNGDAGNDTLLGGNGDDLLNGGTGNDLLDGGAGIDVLNGGAGNDTLSGGNGADRFVFTDATGNDVITDFRRGSDKIDLSGLDANASTAGTQAFSFVGSNAFTRTAGELRTFTENGQNFLAGDVNGDGVADFTIGLGNVVVNQTDIILVG